MNLRIYQLLGVAAFVGAGLVGTPAIAQTAYVIVANNTVLAIDTASNAVFAKIPVGRIPSAVAASPDGTKVYVVNSEDNTVSVIDTASNRVTATVGVGGTQPAEAVAISPDGREVYVTTPAEREGALSVIDARRDKVIATVGVGGSYPIGVAVSPDGSKVYVANHDSDTVSVIATATDKVTAMIAGLQFPYGVAVTPDGSKVYVTNSAVNTVSVIDATSNRVTATIAGFDGPRGVAVTPDGSKVYVANRGNPFGVKGSTVSVIATATNAVTAKVDVGIDPDGIAVTTDGSRVYVPNRASDTLSMIDAATNAVTTISDPGFSRPSAFGVFIAPFVARRALVSGTACNGIYDDVFRGNVTVSANQFCAFVNGGQITGNVDVTGGNFILKGATVGGDVAIGAGTFTLATATIGGSLTIEGIPPGSTGNSICGTKVTGVLRFSRNSAAVEIGSDEPLICPGNRIGFGFAADRNTGSLSIFDNLVGGDMSVNKNGFIDVTNNKIGGTLQCLGNADVFGGNNTAKKKLGECL